MMNAIVENIEFGNSCIVVIEVGGVSFYEFMSVGTQLQILDGIRKSKGTSLGPFQSN